MYILTTKAEFDSAHFLSGYEGKCSNIHGHRWKVVIDIAANTLEEQGQTRGMLVDFSKLKKDLKKEADALDHAFIIEEGTLKESLFNALKEEGFHLISVPFRPTAENFANYFYTKMAEKGYSVKRATVYETPNNCASYEE
ncbi:MAG: 6-carboxytetrahydropterin synthase QueD [Lachnospiraceae bacterium]|nr:6-carboxytetrahydropterin synthase QueD [Lachnospiraceae bacterium]